MSPLIGHDGPVGQFSAAWASRRLHHAWLLAGPRGVGKATFAQAAALRVLADAAGPASGPGLEVLPEHRIARLFAAGSHPDFRLLERLERDRPASGLARNINIGQVRGLATLLDVTPSQSPWRVIVIDSADDLEGPAANALLKMLEEPPANTLFFLVAHAPGKLLPTIRSRCRRLAFDPLGDDTMASLLERMFPDEDCSDVIALAGGSPGRAMQLKSLDLAPLLNDARVMMAQGDRDNLRRAKLASALGGKAQAERYAAFLDLAPGLVAAEARTAAGARRARVLDAYAKVRETVALAPRLSLDAGATAFALGGLFASVADLPASLKR